MVINSKLRFILFVVVIIASNSLNASARQNLILGSVGVGYDHWERTFDDETAARKAVGEFNGDRREYYISPEIDLQSSGIHDQINLRYAPVIKYDDLLDTTEVDHYLDFQGSRFFTKDWHVSLTDSYILSEDPTRYETPFYTTSDQQGEDDTRVDPLSQAPDNITQNLGRRTYWSNNLLFQNTYTYAEDSDIGLGYSYRVLRDDSDNEVAGQAYDEYDRHDFSGLWSYRFNPSYKTQLDLAYINGLYEDRENPENPANVSQDLQEYRASLRLDYNKNATNNFPLVYKFRGTQYDDLRQDIDLHDVTAGWDHSFDSRTRLFIGAGPSYVDADELDAEWGYNGYFEFSRLYQHGSINALFNRRYVPRNFTGANDTGLTYTSFARIDGTYQFTKDFTSSLFALYRNEEIINPQAEFYQSALEGADPSSEQSVGDITYTRESYSAGASIDYTFFRWFVATLRYSYYNQDGALAQETYEDHRVMFQIAGKKELWR